MNEADEVKELLTAIRDLLREHLDDYKRMTQRSLELQERAVKRQEEIGNLYRRMVVFGFLLIGLIIALILHLLGKLNLVGP